MRMCEPAPVSSAWRHRAVLVLVSVALAGMAQAASLLPYEVVEDAIPRPLTAQPGDPQRGRAILLDRSKGNCVTCHELPLRADFQGNLGPPLAGVGSRYRAGELRLRLVDGKRINPESNMPSYYKVEGLRDVRREFLGKPILEAQEVEDVLAFLLTLK
jgi:sulfur-oxidizing protein SoxX